MISGDIEVLSAVSHRLRHQFFFHTSALYSVHGFVGHYFESDKASYTLCGWQNTEQKSATSY
jgi:hypothetical protein